MGLGGVVGSAAVPAPQPEAQLDDGQASDYADEKHVGFINFAQHVDFRWLFGDRAYAECGAAGKGRITRSRGSLPGI
jgi:hypothetical protein